MNKTISKQVKSPCQLIYTIKRGIDKVTTSPVEISEDTTHINVSYPCRDIMLEELAKRLTRSIFGYYSSYNAYDPKTKKYYYKEDLVDYDGDKNKLIFKCWKDSSKDNLFEGTTIELKYENQRATASFKTYHEIDESDIQIA